MSQISTTATSSLRSSILTQSASTHAATSPATTVTSNFSFSLKPPIDRTASGSCGSSDDARPAKVTPHLAVVCETPQTHEPDQVQHLSFLVSARIDPSEEGSRPCPPPLSLSPTTKMERPRAGLPWNSDGSEHVPVNMVLMLGLVSSGCGHQIKVEVVQESCRRLRGCLKRGDRLGVLVLSAATTWQLLEMNTDEDYDTLREALASAPQSHYARKMVNLVEGVELGLSSLLTTHVEAACPTLMLVCDGAITDKDRIHKLTVRANFYNITIHSFGLGLAHGPDSLVNLASRTMGAYNYVKDWLALPEYLMSGMQLVQKHLLPNVRLRLRLLPSSPAVFASVKGAHLVSTRSRGEEKVVLLGNLALSEQRDIVVHMDTKPYTLRSDGGMRNLLTPARTQAEQHLDKCTSQDIYHDSLDLFQIDMSWEETNYHDPQICQPDPVVVRLATRSNGHRNPPAMLSDSNMVQRHAELFTADLLSKALSWNSAGYRSDARLLLADAYQAIERLLSPHSTATPSPTSGVSTEPRSVVQVEEIVVWNAWFANQNLPSRLTSSGRDRARPLEPRVIFALLAELRQCWQWIDYPQVFELDSRKRALHAIAVLSFQQKLGRQDFFGPLQV